MKCHFQQGSFNILISNQQSAVFQIFQKFSVWDLMIKSLPEKLNLTI